MFFLIKFHRSAKHKFSRTVTYIHKHLDWCCINQYCTQPRGWYLHRYWLSSRIRSYLDWVSSPYILLLRTVQSSNLCHRWGAGSKDRGRLPTAGGDHTPAVSNRRSSEESKVCEWARPPTNSFNDFALFFVAKLWTCAFLLPVCGGEWGAFPTPGGSQRCPEATYSGGNFHIAMMPWPSCPFHKPSYFTARNSFRSWRRNTQSASRCYTKLRRSWRTWGTGTTPQGLPDATTHWGCTPWWVRPWIRTG